MIWLAMICGGFALALPASAQSNSSESWWEPTIQRIRAIYQRRELNAKPFNATWLGDSSGFIVRQRTGEGQSPVPMIHDVASGEQREADAATVASVASRELHSPDGQFVLQVRGKSIVANDTASDLSVELYKATQDRDLRFHSLAWSPDSRRVLFVQADETDIRKRPVLVPTDPSYPKVRHDRFARVGERIPELRVGWVDLQTRQTQWLPIQSPEEGFYLGQVEWAGNSHEVLVETLSRFRDTRTFTLFNVDSGDTEQLYTETNDAWAVSSQEKNLRLIWVQDGKAFIVISEQDGWRHAFLYSRSGERLALLTPGDFDVIDRGQVDHANGWFYFYASPSNATQRYLYRVALDGSGTATRVTPDDQTGSHEYAFSPDSHWAIHTYSNFDTPPVIDLVELPSHRSVRVLEPNTELQSVAKQWVSHPTEFLRLTTINDVTMDALLIKPKDFDATKKYPVFVYVYGEPHAQTVLDQWGAGQAHFHRVVADLGYIVVSIDNRGTPAPKGAAWRRAIFGSLGPLSTDDQAEALQALGRVHSFVDLSRVGIWGWSGGGSNTLNAMFRKPDVYNVGIAVVPKPQPHLYNAWFQEIYMRTREVNAEGYERSAPINFAQGLQGDLLIITGSGETNTHIQIIEGLVDRLIELGKPFDYRVYPNRDHGLREGPGSEVHVRMMIIRYLLQHLPPNPINNIN